MQERKQKIEELLADLQALRRAMSFSMKGQGNMPHVTPSQWGVLMLVLHNKKSSVKEVAQALSISSSASTQLVDGLVRSGYLMRVPSDEDRRTVILTLTKKAKSHMEAMKRQNIQKFLKAFAVLSEKEFDQFCALHKKLAQKTITNKK